MFKMSLKQIVRSVLFESKWILIPFFAGLIVAQALYCIKFVQEVTHLCFTFTTISENELMLTVLMLVDIVMIANLLKMIITGSYQTFIEKVQDSNEEETSSGELKVKMGGSLIGVSSIHLLQVFINPGTLSSKEIIIKCSIHTIFLLSTIVLSVIEYLHCLSANLHQNPILEKHDR